MVLLLLPKRIWYDKRKFARAQMQDAHTADQWQPLHGQCPHACACARFFVQILAKWTAAGSQFKFNDMYNDSAISPHVIHIVPDDGSAKAENVYFVCPFVHFTFAAYCYFTSFSFGRQTDAKGAKKNHCSLAHARTFFIFFSLVICVSLLRFEATPLCVCVCVHIYVLDFCLFCAHSFAPTDDDAVCVGTLPHCACGLCSFFPIKHIRWIWAHARQGAIYLENLYGLWLKAHLYGCTESIYVSCSAPTPHILLETRQKFRCWDVRNYAW